MLRSIGADTVIDYLQEDFTQNGEIYDVIIDMVGKSPFSRSVRFFCPQPGLGAFMSEIKNY